MTVNRREDVLANGGRSSTPQDIPLNIRESSGILIVIDVTAQGGAGALRVQLLAPGVNPANLAMFAQNAAANDVTAVGTWAFLVYPQGIEAAPTLAGAGLRERLSFPIPSECKLRIFHGNGNLQFYSVRVYYLS